MKLVKITYQYRRDFRGTFECEACGHTVTDKSGYDDKNFHENVIPSIKCPKCGKSSKDIGVVNTPMKPKYAEGYQI